MRIEELHFRIRQEDYRSILLGGNKGSDGRRCRIRLYASCSFMIITFVMLVALRMCKRAKEVMQCTNHQMKLEDTKTTTQLANLSWYHTSSHWYKLHFFKLYLKSVNTEFRIWTVFRQKIVKLKGILRYLAIMYRYKLSRFFLYFSVKKLVKLKEDLYWLARI